MPAVITPSPVRKTQQSNPGIHRDNPVDLLQKFDAAIVRRVPLLKEQAILKDVRTWCQVWQDNAGKHPRERSPLSYFQLSQRRDERYRQESWNYLRIGAFTTGRFIETHDRAGIENHEGLFMGIVDDRFGFFTPEGQPLPHARLTVIIDPECEIREGSWQIGKGHLVGEGAVLRFWRGCSDVLTGTWGEVAGSNSLTGKGSVTRKWGLKVETLSGEWAFWNDDTCYLKDAELTTKDKIGQVRKRAPIACMIGDQWYLMGQGNMMRTESDGRLTLRTGKWGIDDQGKNKFVGSGVQIIQEPDGRRTGYQVQWGSREPWLKI